jgi:diaminopimelate epimerase
VTGLCATVTHMLSSVPFFKYEGLGNDFIVVEADDERAISPAQAARLCDRHLGVGADGVLLILPSRASDCAFRMRVINADGSVPEMCGNGARCVALHRARAGGVQREVLRIDTDAGARDCTVEDGQGQGWVSVDMGIVRVLGERTLLVGGRHFSVVAVDVGNPHAVLFGAFARGDVEQVGPRIATHPDFPRGTNVEFAHVGEDGIDLMVWERGAGITLACGTGACATAAAARTRGLVPAMTPIAVRLPGGALSVTVDQDDRAFLRGPARHVFSGTLAPQPHVGPASILDDRAD